ncbi:hypothetical protein Mesau_02905 [Mesorhizobium australicum WSM2073]|uniref:Uncharacterized protein n=1 Tax=Mesorhizobium australicum (strain HAMBI 3006 / LMG 24608 / WSM2073) TaxID=754035 RepID=L0KIY7_MESAW|nr:hypothetical protein Mesau_02905 [Mesorhizobium australicum WSM2073]
MSTSNRWGRGVVAAGFTFRRRPQHLRRTFSSMFYSSLSRADTMLAPAAFGMSASP